MFEIRQRLCRLCLVGKIVPEHCTTILKAATATIGLKTKQKKAFTTLFADGNTTDT